jgi:amino-acid N-acetyltransferase
VAGCRHQIDIRLEDGDDAEHRIGGKVMMSSIRVTDEDTLRVVKEEAGMILRAALISFSVVNLNYSVSTC